jgi:hypothetical protein
MTELQAELGCRYVQYSRARSQKKTGTLAIRPVTRRNVHLALGQR